MVKIGSNDITSKIGDKRPKLVSVSSKPQEEAPSGSGIDVRTDIRKGETAVTKGIGEHPNEHSMDKESSVDDYVLTEKDKQGLEYEQGYHAIKDFYAHEIAMRDGNPVAPKERDYCQLWKVSDTSEYAILIEYCVKTWGVFTSKKKANISSSTLEVLANEKNSTKIHDVKMDYESRGRLRALIDISLIVLHIGDIEKSDAMVLLRNTYLALYVAVGKISGSDAKYLANLAMLRNTPEVTKEWSRIRNIYRCDSSASTNLSLPSALVYEREKPHLTQQIQAQLSSAETSNRNK